jgi:hypothetical protein
MKSPYQISLIATGAATIRTKCGALVTQYLDGTTVFVKQLPQTLGVMCGTVLKRNKN